MCITDFGTVFLVLGITTVVGSILSVTIQATATALVLTSGRSVYTGYVSAGVWCGALFFATGVMSIILGKRLRNPYISSRSHTGLLGGVLGMSVACLIFCIMLFAFGIVASLELNFSSNFCRFPDSFQDGYRPYHTTTPSPYRKDCFDGSFGMGVALALIAMTQFAISVASIIYSDRLLCYRSRVTGPDDLGVTYNSQPTSGFSQQVVYMMPVPTGNYGAPGAYAPQMNAGYVLPPINLVPNPVYVAAQPIATTTLDAVRSPPSYGDTNQPVLEEPFSSEHGHERYAKL